MSNAVVVFTAKQVAEIINDGSGHWTLDPGRARKCEYLICTRNARTPDWATPSTEAHGSGFLVGRVSGVVPSNEVTGRWVIKIDEYAEIDMPDLWPGVRNPVHYDTIEKLGIDLDTLSFVPVPKSKNGPSASAPKGATTAALAIAEAKTRLAATLGVPREAIEIIIRG